MRRSLCRTASDDTRMGIVPAPFGAERSPFAQWYGAVTFERSSYEKDIKTSDRIFLILVLVLSLCACAQKQQAGTDEPNRSADGETLSGMPDQKLPEKLRRGRGSDMQPTPTGFSAEAEQSLVWLRERMAFPQTMFGAAFLGYTGEASDGDWLSETDQATLQKYLLFPKSIRGIPSGTMIICIVSCRLMKMPRFPSISCGGIRNQILKRSLRFSTGLKLEIRC